MKQQPWLRLLAVLAALAMVVAACGGDDDDSASNATTTSGPKQAANDRGNVDGQFVLGALLPQSGDLSAIYKSLKTPITMAVDEINAAGGVNGKDMVIKDADDGTSADVATQSLDTLLNSDKVDGILGAASSGTTLGILDKVVTNGVVECSGSNTSAELTDANDKGFYFRTAPPDKFQGPALAQVVINDGKSKVAILTRNDSYGTGFGDALETALTDGGAQVVTNTAYDPNASDFSSDVGKVKAAGPDAVIVIGFIDDGGKVVKEMIAQGIGPKNMAIYTADGMQSSSFYKGVDASNPGVVAGIKGTAPAAAVVGVNHPFIAAFKKTGVDTIFSSYYYDCTVLLALAAQAAGTDDPAKVKDEVVNVSKDGEKCQTYKDCLALLKDGKDINYEGAAGPEDLTDVGEPNVGSYDVWAYDAQGAYANVPNVQQIKIQG
jgi:ABC-type branched-subunit amino acid transport system substrate-binding protein